VNPELLTSLRQPEDSGGEVRQRQS
jgi:hypothetical protein